MKTHFAPPARADAAEIAVQIGQLCDSPVVSGLLDTVGGVLAVLNEQRQILAVNDAFMRLLGIDDPQGVLGLRTGEALDCRFSGDAPSGCGTSLNCETCGAAVAMMAALSEGRPEGRLCALSARRAGEPVDLALLVRAHPIDIGGQRLLLLFVQDVTRQQQRAALERTFFHDINNMLYMVAGASELLRADHPSQLTDTLVDAVRRLRGEVEIQRSLHMSDSEAYSPVEQRVSMSSFFTEVQAFFSTHPVAQGRRVEVVTDHGDATVATDRSLLLRIVTNMMTNALEATEVDGTVRVWAAPGEGSLTIKVWNAGEIPAEIRRRIFQRNFSTKEQAGRGLGTWSMKLFGETILGGRVGFTTSRDAGTIFSLAIPS